MSKPILEKINKIEVVTKSVVYELQMKDSKDQYTMKVEIDDVGRFTIKGGKDFTFIRSQRKVVRAIGMMLVKSAGLPGKRNI